MSCSISQQQKQNEPAPHQGPSIQVNRQSQRQVCWEAGLSPHRWQGPSAALPRAEPDHDSAGTMTRSILSSTPKHGGSTERVCSRHTKPSKYIFKQTEHRRLCICQACCLAFPAWVTGRASVHSCSRDIMPCGPKCLVLLSTYTASLQSYPSVPLVWSNFHPPFTLSGSPLICWKKPDVSSLFRIKTVNLQELCPTRADCSWLSLVFCYDSGVSRCLSCLK